MRKINYRLMISDFDGTLAGKDGVVSEYTINTVNEYIASGGIFVVSTGRQPGAILPIVREIGLEGLVSCHQGAVIMDIENGKMLLNGTMDKGLALEICEKMEALDLHIHAYSLQEYYTNRYNDIEAYYQKVIRLKGVLTGKMSAYIRDDLSAVYKLTAVVSDEEQERVFPILQAAFGERAQVTMSADCLLEVCHKDYSKGTALRFLSDYYDIPIEKTFAVGDQLNDISMIEAAGLGATVKNGHADIKARAKIVSEYTNEEDAVAHFIEKYGYMEDLNYERSGNAKRDAR